MLMQVVFSIQKFISTEESIRQAFTRTIFPIRTMISIIDDLKAYIVVGHSSDISPKVEITIILTEIFCIPIIPICQN